MQYNFFFSKDHRHRRSNGKPSTLLVTLCFLLLINLALTWPVATANPAPNRTANHKELTKAASPENTVALKDITITPGNDKATITFLVSGSVKTVVVEKKGTTHAQVRMKSMSATPHALNSPLLKPGVTSVKAHIERTDVLITNVHFTHEVQSMKVTTRTAEKVVVLVALGKKRSAQSTPTITSSSGNDKWKLSTIVIDAGHGGKDPGAIGIGDLQEKKITLAVAKHLKSELQKTMPGVNVVMTRDDDSFVELYRRSEIANEAGGRLFISIHCNSMPEKPHPAHGFECWILRPGKSNDAARVASRENGAIRYESNRKRYDSLDAEMAILGSLAQSAFARYSEELGQELGAAMKSGTGMNNRGVHQAGFYVLVGTAMPAVLVELGYLSNEKDAKFLKSSSGQQKLATAIAKGIREYERTYSESLR